MFESVIAGAESSVASYCRSFPRVFDHAKGAELWDAEGNRWIDFLSGAGALNYGHNPEQMKQALLDYISDDRIGMSLDLWTVAKAQFLNAFTQNILEPRGLDYAVQFTGPTGTNAVEAALKLARLATGRSSIGRFTNGFHGMTLGALAATGNGFHRSGAGVGLTDTQVLPFDGYFGDDVDTLAIIERLFDDPSSGVDLPAAVLLECVQGEGGLNVARPEWLQGLARLCQARGVLLIVDDIQAGCGRSGRFFSFEDAGITPDIVVLSKSLSGFGQPLSIVLHSRALDIWKPGQHNGTFRGNCLAFVTARVMIETYWADDRFQKALARDAIWQTNRLQRLAAKFPDMVTGLKGKGLMQGVVCHDPNVAAAVGAAAFQRGLIIERCGPQDEVMKIFAPLTISRRLLEEGFSRLEQAFCDVSTPSRHVAA